ncbi:OmpA family protein [Janibacter cremeus]|uniref:Outer membrane protein OmpA-like peptidoglycan-associated protein n=1 Tax=Janibacter cremeus TaxID=1285192 RepID=A0A852VMF4_9MICO|nr:OmpA family protein [Janibacter cremeus]NYF98257.1 outer membrane protein OmpA-like peptidoglycan-associated protein [Janibacter cremeus]
MSAMNRGERRPGLGPALAGAASVAALVLSGLAVAAPAHAEDELPILGQSMAVSNQDTTETVRDVLITVHGVRRVEDATMVYWSVGFTPDSTGGDKFVLTAAFGNESELSPPRSGTTSMGDVAVVDLPGRKAYTTLYAGDTMYDCICQSLSNAVPDSPEPGTAYATAAALPPIPEDMDTVTLRVAGQLFPDIPVEEGKMTPTVDADEPIVAGMGWPEVDTEAINEVDDPSAFIVPLTTHSVVEDSAISERSEADSRSIDLSADVLFDVDKATLTGRAKKEIKAAAKSVKEADVSGKITVTGHTDSSGAEDYNQDLSERRAQSVAEALEPLLPSEVTIKTAGKGEGDPIATNGTVEGKALNRRVTITLPGAK